MADETITPNNDPVPQVPTPAPEPSTPATADPVPVEMPPEAPEAPKATPVIESPNIPVNTGEIEEKEPETPPAGENKPNPEPIPTPTPAPVPEPPKEEPREEVKEVAPVIVPVAKSRLRELFAKAREVIQFRKRKKLDRLITLFLKKPQITNDDVEKLLHISDATAGRYLSILEKEGKIKRSGKTGKGVTYTRL